MKLSTLFLPFIAAQKTTPEPVDERAVIFNRLPKVFNWYEIVITKFVRGKKAGKYIHRVNELKQRIVWETDRCEAAGPKKGRYADEDNLVLNDLSESLDELEQLMNDDDFLKQVSDEFEYEENDELYTPDDDSSERKIGNRPTKPNKDTPWKATTMVGNPNFDTVGRPPRVLLYRLNKTIIKWFNNFMPAHCRKYTRIYKRLKGLKRQLTKLMPKHEYQFEA